MSNVGFHRSVRIVLACVLVLVSARIAWAHIRLDRSTPGRDEVIAVMPSELRLEFSGTIEPRYTSLSLSAPDGSGIPIGDVVFVVGSDRIITTRVPPLTAPGTYVVTWRTAGADGHVLEGSYSFILAVDSALSAPGDSAAAASADSGGVASSNGRAAGTSDGAPHGAHGEHAHEEPETVGGTGAAAGRGVHFLALLLLTGAIAFRVALIPRLPVDDETSHALRRRSWRVLTIAAVLLAGSAVLRLWLQSTALHGAERAWNGALLSIMLQDTAWGRAWVLQVFMFAVLGAAIAWARPGGDAIAARIALVSIVALCAIPALSGHAAGASGPGWIVVANDTLHVFAAGAWLGTLALLLLSLRTLAAGDRSGHGAARAIDAFSPLALVAAALVLISGLINTVVHLTAIDQLWTTNYGRTLIVKLILVALVLLAGFLNWRIVRPRLRRISGDVSRLRLTASAEIVFALLVLAATAVLTGQPRP